MDREMETRHLAIADRHLVEGQLRIADQVALIAVLAARGAGTQQAEDFLALLNQTLAGWQDHRELIVAMLARPPAGGQMGEQTSPCAMPAARNAAKRSRPVTTH